MILEVEGKPPVTMKQGDASHLSPREVHDVKNASATAPMKALIFQILKKVNPSSPRCGKEGGVHGRHAGLVLLIKHVPAGWDSLCSAESWPNTYESYVGELEYNGLLLLSSFNNLSQQKEHDDGHHSHDARQSGDGFPPNPFSRVRVGSEYMEAWLHDGAAQRPRERQSLPAIATRSWRRDVGPRAALACPRRPGW